MKKMSMGAVAAIATLALAAPASAATTTDGAYTQSTRYLTCSGHVQGNGDGGTLKVMVSGHETRASDQHFRTYSIQTRIIAQEKNYNGAWVSVAKGHWKSGALGDAVSDGETNVAPFMWGGSSEPTLSVPVAGFDDLFRAKVVSRLYDDEGVKIRKLTTYQGQCRL